MRRSAFGSGLLRWQEHWLLYAAPGLKLSATPFMQ